MSKNPTVSVVMAVYNTEKYLAQAVESILNQTFGNFEFIIIDDGSTDGSLKILEAYAAKDKRICLISRENQGISRTRNELLAKAKGEFLAVMDSDDIALPERLARQVEFLEHNRDVVGVGCAREVIDEKGRLLICAEEPEDNDRIQQSMLAGFCSICNPSAMIRRSSLIEVGGYDEALAPSEDLDLWLRLGEVGKLANLKDKLLKYRIHNKSASEQSQTLQRTNAQIACERAWQRRGMKDALSGRSDRVLERIVPLNTASRLCMDGGPLTAVNVRQHLSTG